MTNNATAILEAAMELELSDRLELADRLTFSLSDEEQREIEAAWATEIDRRVAESDAGRGMGRSWEEVRDQLR